MKSWREFYGCFLGLGERDQYAARRVVEQRRPDRALPPACRPGGALVVAQHDQICAYFLGGTADFLHRIADREAALGLEPFVRKGLDALVEHRLGALFLLLQ